MQLSWSFPDRTFTPIVKFVIKVEFIKTSLRSSPSIPGLNCNTVWKDGRIEIIDQQTELSREGNNREPTKTWVTYNVPSCTDDKKYQRDYTIKIHELPPSSEFEIIIYAQHASGSNGNPKSTIKIITTDSVSFNRMIQGRINDQDSTILLTLPNITNNVENSKTFLILKSPESCDHYQDRELPKQMVVDSSSHLWLVLTDHVSNKLEFYP